MARRELPEINAGSMADIAFLLLIFFLVSTTMDTDMGIVRKLPPMPENKENQEDIKVKERNIFVVLVNKNDQLMVEGEQMALKDLRKAAKEFILNEYDEDDLPIREEVMFDEIGMMKVTKKHVISLQNDRGTSYETYITVQNELAAAYTDLRNQLANRKWGKDYDKLNEELQDIVSDVYPMKISEAEPKNIGGE